MDTDKIKGKGQNILRFHLPLSLSLSAFIRVHLRFHYAWRELLSKLISAMFAFILSVV
jgi:hypothetical protein